MNAVETRDLKRQFQSRSAETPVHHALAGIDLTVPSGFIYGLLGPNGGGKSTLFNILSTLIAPSSGAASIFGLDVVKEPAGVRMRIGVIFQNPSLDKKLTVEENLRHQGHLYGLRGDVLKKRIDSITARLGLSQRLDDFCEILSGGLKRRVEIAKGLLHAPPLLLMDEPSTGLDPGARRELWDLLADLKKQGTTILVTTHLMEEGDRCDRLAILHQGKIVAEGSPDELKQKIGGDVVLVETKDAAGLASRLQTDFSINATVIDGTVRMEMRDGHRFIPQLIEKYPGLIETVRLGKPTLEDVFVHTTGVRFSHAGRQM